MEDFVPERWLVSNGAQNNSDDATPKTIDGLETASFDTSSSGVSLYRPPKGAFVPFADGARSCPGRRFAQVEITAVLAVIFSLYSVELDVSRWASDEEVARMPKADKKVLYGKAVERTRKCIRRSRSTISLKMDGDLVPLRFVKRGDGRERFGGLGF